MAFKGHYLHPESPCSGVTDAVQIDMTIADEGLQEKWIELVGEPEIDDYEASINFEKQLGELKIEHILLESTIESNWLLRNLYNWVKKRKEKKFIS